MTDLLTKLAQWKPANVVVIGDFMLDQTVLGDAERMTGDAPVPILHVRETRHMPGGAANVCVMLAALGACVTAIGLVGDDPEGQLLRDRLRSSGIDCDGLIVDPSRPTTVKRSLVGLAQHRHPQKMFRLDFESCHPPDERVAALLEAKAHAAIARAGVVAIEDYDKGVLRDGIAQRLIAHCNTAGVETLVDPAGIPDYARYAGATCITPNRTEAERATAMATHATADTAHNAALARALQDRFKIHAVVLTLDRHGALLQLDGNDPMAIPTVAREVYDVTGAGDMVLAALAAARANGLAWSDAVRFANTAAGLEVEVFGVHAIPFERVYRQVLVEHRRHIGKLRTLDEAAIEVAAARREGRTIVFTNGCFDVLHAGHVRLLQRAAKFGDLLVVGLNSDASVQRLKGPTRPVHSQDDRASVLSELQSVAVVVVFDQDTPMTLLETLRPDVLVKGGDYTKDRVVGAALVESYGGRIELIDHLEGRSSTDAINRLRLA